MNKHQDDLKLLPLHFKKIAFGIIVLSILFVILTQSNLITIQEELIKTISKSTFLIALLILAITRNKIEDELTLRIRLRAFAAAFIYGVVFAIFKPYLNLLLGDKLQFEASVYELLMSMFFFYFIMMFILKNNRY